MTSTISPQFLTDAEKIVGCGNIDATPRELIHFQGDRSTLWNSAPSAVVRPNTIEQVADLVVLCNQYGIAIVPAGGRTGLSGGAVAANGEVVFSMERMNKILQINRTDQTITCQCGVTTRQLQDSAVQCGLYYPIDFASAGSSHIGGNIATNAGGIKVIGYGMTRHWVRGLIVVTGQGDILDLNKGLIKNNCGYDLQQLFIGSEGSLGIICETTMALCKAPVNLTVMVCASSSLLNIVELLNRFRQQIELTAFEFFDHYALHHVTANQCLNKPFPSSEPYYILLEFDNDSDTVEATALSLFRQALSDQIISDGVMSSSIQQAKNLWRLREDISEQLAPFKPYKNDISVTVSRLPVFINDVERLLEQYYPGWQIVWYGHIGDGNLHLNILKPESCTAEDFINSCHQVSSLLADLVKRHAGSISAEHGVGLLKKPFLASTRSAIEIELMKQIKILLDPNNIMNPGKIFDLN